MLTSQWENTEEVYIDSCKKVFGMIRHERELIHRYFYGTRLEITNNETIANLSLVCSGSLLYYYPCLIWVAFLDISGRHAIVDGLTVLTTCII